MSRKLKKMLLCLLLIAALCVVYELWLAPYLAVLNGEPVQDSTQAEVSEVPGITVQAREGLKEAYKVDGLNVSISGPEPRTAIGYLGPNHFLILVVDGRQTGYSRGMAFEELAKVFVEHGCTLAYNLDGGGSVTLYQDGEIVNSPCPLVGKERNISDILYVEAGEQ